MIVLGVDPGFDRLGYGVVREEKGKQTLIATGCMVTKRIDNDGQRLLQLYREFSDLLRQYRPDSLALESLFFTTNAKTVIGVGQARGVILLASAQGNIPVVTYAPLQVKLAVTGYGKAEKTQVQQMVKSILGLSSIPKPDDAADAVAIALTHCFSHRLLVQSLKSKVQSQV